MKTIYETDPPGRPVATSAAFEAAARRERRAGSFVQKDAVRLTFLLQNQYGLHCRPAALLIKTLRDFDCSVHVQSGGMTVDARSMMGLLSLAAVPGTKLTFTAVGTDAAGALNALQRLFEDNFSEAYAWSPRPGN